MANERFFRVLYKAHIICLIIISESVFIGVNRCTKTFDIDSIEMLRAHRVALRGLFIGTAKPNLDKFALKLIPFPNE